MLFCRFAAGGIAFVALKAAQMSKTIERFFFSLKTV
jgi:ABC-type enterobactin transport system permease subunit